MNSQLINNAQSKDSDISDYMREIEVYLIHKAYQAFKLEVSR